MKSLILPMLACIIAVQIYAQENEAGSKSPVKLPKLNILNDSRYTIEAEILKVYTCKYIIKKEEDNNTKKEFTLTQNSLEAFTYNFTRSFLELASGDTEIKKRIDANKNLLDDEARILFNSFVTSERTVEDIEYAPAAGKLCFNQNISVQRENLSDDSVRYIAKCIRRALRISKVNDTIYVTAKSGADSVVVKKSNVNNPCKNPVIVNCFRTTRPLQLPCWLRRPRIPILWARSAWKSRIRIFSTRTYDSLINLSLYRIEKQYDSLEDRIEAYQAEISGKVSDSSKLKSVENKTTRQVDSIATKIQAMRTKMTVILQNVQNDALLGSIEGLTVRQINVNSQADIDTLLNQLTNIRISVARHRNDIRARITNFTDSIRLARTLPDSLERRYRAELEIEKLRSRLLSDSSNERTLMALRDSLLATGRIRLELERLQRDSLNMASNTRALQLQMSTLVTRLSIARDSLALLGLKSDTLCLHLATQRKKRNFVDYNISSIKIEFNDGFMENIVVEGNLNFPSGNCMPDLSASAGFLKFNNNYPIGFSRKADFLAYKKYFTLYATNSDGSVYRLPLNKLFPEYIEELQVDRKDFSPKDYIFTVDLKKGDRCQTLVKDETSKLFEARIYTDLVGVADDREPNGLVQTEISKKVYLNTFRERFPFLQWKYRITVGIFAYIEPEATFSKVENNNRRLLLSVKDRVVNNQYVPLKYASTIDLRRYQNFSAGFDLNLGVLDLPNMKSTLYVDAGFRYGRTSIRDSLRSFKNFQIVHEKLASDYGVNTTEFCPRFVWDVRADERYSFSFSYRHHWFYLRDNRFGQVPNLETFSVNERPYKRVNKEYSSLTLGATINPGPQSKGKIFARYRFFWQQGFWRTTFHQIQLGYSFYILGRKN